MRIKRTRVRIIVITLVIFIASLIGAYFFLQRDTNTVPSIPPTPEELRRMDEIDRSSASVAPNAIPGAGVRPKGSLPRTPPPDPATSSAATTTPITETVTTTP